jgi:beta-glucosidase
MFALGLFDNPYVDPDQADTVVANDEFGRAAWAAHQKSVVLMKNSGDLLPLRPDRLGDWRIYVELFEADLQIAKLDGLRADLAAAHPDIAFTTDYRQADVAVLFCTPYTGSYFEFTGLNDLEVHENTDVDLTKIREIRSAVSRLVIGVNVKMPWLLGNVEPLADAMVAGFDTRTEALFEVIVGNVEPSGRLPLTFPRDADAVAVDENGLCASPNDVPGYDKEAYMGGPALRVRRCRRQPLWAGSRPVLPLT